MLSPQYFLCSTHVYKRSLFIPNIHVLFSLLFIEFSLNPHHLAMLMKQLECASIYYQPQSISIAFIVINLSMLLEKLSQVAQTKRLVLSIMPSICVCHFHLYQQAKIVFYSFRKFHNGPSIGTSFSKSVLDTRFSESI